MSTDYVIGIDEAGYGPKLGPLVIGVTVWSVKKKGDVPFDFWRALEAVVSNSPGRGDDRLHVADSKEVYSSGKGLEVLERSVLGFSALAGYRSESLMEFIKQLSHSIPPAFEDQPWYRNRDLPLPLACDKGRISEDRFTLKQVMESHQLKLERIAVEIICPARFNQLIDQYGNKSELLTRCSLNLLKQICPETDGSKRIWADKHGGRNRYLNYLHEAFPEQLFFTERESQQQSRYRSGNTCISFGVNSERHFPVALASMVAKYVRETCMELFNHYWREHLADLKPTKGYPQDAKRFRADIDHLLARLCPDERVLWRTR